MAEKKDQESRERAETQCQESSQENAEETHSPASLPTLPRARPRIEGRPQEDRERLKRLVHKTDLAPEEDEHTRIERKFRKMQMKMLKLQRGDREIH
jgi:hypothetical protein